MNFYQLICGFISIFLNVVLITVILLKSPKSLGMYKYLMCYISLFEAFYSVWDMITEPIVHSHKAAFVVLRYFNDTAFDRDASFVLICVYCGLFGFSLAIFGVHFIYRYGTVNKAFGDKFLQGNRVYTLFVIPIWYGVWWGVLCYIYFYFSPITDEYMSETIMTYYDMLISETSYICVYFQPTGSDGLPHPDPKIFFSIGCMWYMIISSMFCVFNFGIRCYLKINEHVASAAIVSNATRVLQKQLFNALVVQTLIPLILMYIPIGILFFFPMVIWELPFNTNFVGYTIALYPAIDPLPNMIIIKCYRHAIKDALQKIAKCGKQTESQPSVNTVHPQLSNNTDSADNRFV